MKFFCFSSLCFLCLLWLNLWIKTEKTMSERSVTFYRWDEMPKEPVSEMLDRRLITGDRMMLAHVYIKKGAIVPRHSHENEQITYILEGVHSR